MSFGTRPKTNRIAQNQLATYRQMADLRVNPTRRPLHKKTVTLRRKLLDLLDTLDKPVTCRQVFYQASVHGLVNKAETGYRQVQRQLLEMRREGVTPYSTIADNTRWMRKPRTYASLADALETTATQYRASVWSELDTPKCGARKMR
ncbi:MAG: hypothetical protein R3F53_18250 [Gammaproteobacteria bacterium]